MHELSIGVCGLSGDALVFVSKIGIGRVQRFVLHQLVFELEVYIGVNSSSTVCLSAKAVGLECQPSHIRIFSIN
jgi:hypothetical protein